MRPLGEIQIRSSTKGMVIRQLQDMGLGLRELKQLYGTIHEVAAEHKIPENLAVQKFFEDIERVFLHRSTGMS